MNSTRVRRKTPSASGPPTAAAAAAAAATDPHARCQPAKEMQQSQPVLATGCRIQRAFLYYLFAITLCTLSRADSQLLNTLLSPQYEQHNNILYFEVPENAPNGTFIGNIRSADGQKPHLILPLPQTPESERVAALTVNFVTGDLTTNSPLDREHREQYHFVAIVQEPFAEIKCTVTVKDVNDNAPMFLMASPNETNFVIDMPEGQRGVRKALPLAVDLDSAQFGIKEFRIVSGNTPSGLFHLVEHDTPARSSMAQSSNLASQVDDTTSMLGADNPQLLQQLAQQATVLIPSQPVMQSFQNANPQIPQAASSLTSSPINQHSLTQQQIAAQSKFSIDLEVSQPLDRENQSSYQLVVEAIDGGQPPLLGRLMVTVNVQDVNDNDPVFPRKLYECHVKEDAPRGQLIQRVQAYDIDLDSNGQISYYLKRHSSPSQPINPLNSNSSDNNEISANRFLTPANPVGGRQRTQQALTSTSNSKSTSSRQGANPEVHDAPLIGSPSEPSLSFKTRQSNYGSDQLFEIDQIKGEVYLANPLDFETDQVHELLVEARDHGKPSRSSFTTIKVHVIDVNDDPVPSAVNRNPEDKRQTNNNQLLSNDLRAETSVSERLNLVDFSEAFSQQGFNIQNMKSWFAELSSPVLFVIVLAALVIISFSVCFVKIKSRQPESDYNDTVGLTIGSNNGQTKPSPNHSTNNIEHANGMVQDSMHHRHHEHQRRSNGSFAGLNNNGIPFGSPGSKMSRYQYMNDSSNLYHNPYPSQQRSRHHSSTSHHMMPDSPVDHQMAHGQGGSRGGTLNMHDHSHHPMLDHAPPGHHSLEHHHHHHQFGGVNHTTSSLTYAHHHSRAALLHQAHHHQSSHQLSSVHQGVSINKGGTMNSVGTHHSNHMPSASPLPETPNTTHSSGLPHNLHEPHHNHHIHNPILPTLPSAHQSPTQLSNTPNHNGQSGNVFAWPPAQGPSSTIGCFGANTAQSDINGTPGSTFDSCGLRASPATSNPIDRWLDLGVPSQLVYSQDLIGSYNWDYLTDWLPEHDNLMHLLQSEASGS